MLSSNANTDSPHSAQHNATASATQKSRVSAAAMDSVNLRRPSASASIEHAPFSHANSSHSSDNDDGDDDNNSDHVDDERYRQFRPPSPIALRTGPKSGMTRNFGFDDDVPLPTTTVPASASAARGARNLGYGVELGLEYPDIPRFGTTSRPSRVDSAWATASKSHWLQDQQPTVVDDPLASFAIPMLSTANPKSAFAPSPTHPPTTTTSSTHYRASNNNNTNSANTDDRLAQLRAAILDVSADQARDHLRSRQLFTQHRPHINSLVQRLFTVHETDPYFVARTLALLAKLDSPYKRQRVLLALDAMEQEMTKEEERELLGLDADADLDVQKGNNMEQAAMDRPAMVKENSYLHSLHAASSAVKDSLHVHPSPPHVQGRQSPSKMPSSVSSSPVSNSGRHRGRRGCPSNTNSNKSQRVEPDRVRASIGSTIPLFPSSTLASATAPSRSTTSISLFSSPANTRQREPKQITSRGRGEDADSTATCTTVSSSSRSASDLDQQEDEDEDGDDGDRLLDLNSLLLAATTADATTGSATAIIRDQLTQERQRLLFEQEQLRLMLSDLQRDVTVMERVASLQAQRETDQVQLLGGEEHQDQEPDEKADADQVTASAGAQEDSRDHAQAEEEGHDSRVDAGTQERNE